MYVIVVGAGKVGWNIARELLEKGHEVTLIENDRERYQTVEQELEHNIQYGDASELWVLERAGVQRADMVIAVTGDDEDNMLICQVAKEKYLVDRIIARVNNPRNLEHFELLGDSPGGVGDGPDHAPDRARGARVRVGAPARSARAAPRDHRVAPAGGLAGDRAAGGRSALPDGTLLISVLRGSEGLIPNADTVLEPGDEILAVLDPKIEDEVTAYFAASASTPGGMREVDFLLVGGGMASAYCASELRRQGADGSVLLGRAGEGSAV